MYYSKKSSSKIYIGDHGFYWTGAPGRGEFQRYWGNSVSEEIFRASRPIGKPWAKGPEEDARCAWGLGV